MSQEAQVGATISRAVDGFTVTVVRQEANGTVTVLTDVPADTEAAAETIIQRTALHHGIALEKIKTKRVGFGKV